MLFDTLTMAAVADELRQKVLGGRVQRLLRVSEQTLGCEFYANHERRWLLMSVHPQNARVHLAEEKLARGSEDVTPLLLLLRKHVRDGRITAIEQPPLERVLVLTIAKRAEDAGGIQQTKLIIEVMGRHSNIILVGPSKNAVGSDIILDSWKRVPQQLSRYRVVLPNQPYVPPPRQGKTLPGALSAVDVEGQLGGQAPDTPAWRMLVYTVAGMSPLLAREVVYRVTGNAQAGCTALTDRTFERLVSEIKALYAPLENGQWAPCVAREGRGVVAFAPYLLSHVEGVEPCDSISEAVAAYYEDVEAVSPVEVRRGQLLARLAELRDRHGRRKSALERSLRQGEEAERLRWSGEAILSAVGSVTPGQTSLEVEGLAIRLDPTRSPVENAQEFFEEYKKAKSALQQVPGLLAEETSALAYLEEVAAQLDLAQTVEDVRRVAEDLKAGGLSGDRGDERRGGDRRPGPLLSRNEWERAQRSSLGQQAKQRAAARKRQGNGGPGRRDFPLPYRVLGGCEIYLGRSARDNEAVTFSVAGPDDLWLHARGVAGAHVIVKGGGSTPIPEAALKLAAQLAAQFSQAKGNKRVAVDCTARKHVRRVRAGLPGLVTYHSERTIDVRLD